MIDPDAMVMTSFGINAAAQALEVEPAVVRAVAEVESRGSGFLPDGRPVILFEGHQFSKRTGGVYDPTYPTISYPRWTKAHYLGGAREYERFDIARHLNELAAMQSTSWGAFQIMGFNADACGYGNVRMFVDAMHESADKHLAAFVEFVKSQGLAGHLRLKAWVEFARGYNGSGQVPYYAGKLAAAYAKHAASA